MIVEGGRKEIFSTKPVYDHIALLLSCTNTHLRHVFCSALPPSSTFDPGAPRWDPDPSELGEFGLGIHCTSRAPDEWPSVGAMYLSELWPNPGLVEEYKANPLQ